jgi:hypothetical protein
LFEELDRPGHSRAVRADPGATPHPEQGFRACLCIVRLVRRFGAKRFEAAATRAIEIGALTYGSMRSILDNKLVPSPATATRQWRAAPSSTRKREGRLPHHARNLDFRGLADRRTVRAFEN